MATLSSAVTDLAPPSVSVTLAISPSTYKHGDSENAIPDLSVTATLDSSAPKPVTLQTWSTVFNPGLALKRRNFTAQDISQDPPTNIKLEITKGPRRPGFQHKKGSNDERYYVTLYPGQEVTVAKQPLQIVKRTKDDAPVFQAGHTYSLGLSEEGRKVQTWWWGTTDDVLDEVGGPPKDVSGIEGKGDIVLNMEEPVSFEIVE
ncbi:hypothetical protein DL770_000570 [Monosporascus sp. CRB-9-2]|nr:hypothetical protein DL770_000570 [Monosporascus sp. CRB-9-2]